MFLIAATIDHVYAASPSLPTAQLSINNPRPVWVAAQQLAQQYGYRITYEDPKYLYAEDLQDLTSDVADTPLKTGQRRVLGPRNGSINVTYALKNDGKPEDILQVVNDVLLSDTRRIGNRFIYFQDGEYIHVVPVKTKGSSGAWIAQESVLDARITIQPESRSMAQLFKAISNELGKTSGVPVLLASYPMNAFVYTKTEEGSEQEIARDFVVRLLKQFSQRLTWSLNYDPATRSYYFNIEPVSSPSFSPEAPPNSDKTKRSAPHLKTPSGVSNR